MGKRAQTWEGWRGEGQGDEMENGEGEEVKSRQSGW